jgi:hypothetical protein
VSFVSERQAIESYFSASWALRTPVKYQNVSFSRPRGNWVEVEIQEIDGNAITIGTTHAVFRWTGETKICIYTPEDIGTARARMLADLAGAIFLNKTIVISGDEKIIFGLPSISVPVVNLGWLKLELSVLFRHDLTVES